MQQPLSGMSHTHRDFFGFVPPPSYRGTLSLHLQEVLQLGTKRSPHPPIPANTKLPWKLYPNRVEQDYARRRVDQVTLKILRRPMLSLDGS
jgi:hypothetical protein